MQTCRPQWLTMSNNVPTEPMDQDGSPPHYYSAPRTNPSRAGSTATAFASSLRSQVPLSLNTQMLTTNLGSPAGAHGPATPRRIFCPVAGCAEALTSSNRRFRDFKSIKSHLDDHCTGHLSGAIPTEFLIQYSYTKCSGCDKVVHSRLQGICLKCRPIARRREQINSMRGGINIRGASNVSVTTPTPDQQEPNDLPSLSEVHKRFVPTIKNIPVSLRRLWAQCLVRTLAQAVWTNSEADWKALQMLANCTLCRTARGGKSHSSQRLAWSRGRLQRWLAGERTTLWQDLPQYRRPQNKQLSGEVAKRQQQERCIALTSEGGVQ